MPSEQPTEQKQEQNIVARKARISTMPQKFYVDKKTGGGSKNSFLVVAIAIIVILILGVAGYFAYQKYGGTNQASINNENTSAVTTNTSITNNTNNTNNNTALNSNITLNSNFNTNISNLSTNLNTILNTNIDLNNINLFTNSNTNTLININEIPTSVDSDLDGLTDVEEALFGTSVSLADTDGDNFSDGQEVLNGYNPNGPGLLEDSTTVRLYSDSVDGYSLLYPSGWVVADDPQNTRGKIFTTSGEFIAISLQANTALLSARDWYITKSPGIDSSQVKSVSNWDKTMTGVASLDGLTVYFTSGSLVYVVSYNTNILSEANYSAVFQMMYKSLTLTSSSSNTNSALNININSNTNNFNGL
ncbi:hypothetical protein IID19_02135 [Patescibacteria group bacterium]|nr:hypothetical protein [Patescibacteria group bacterium]